MKRIKLNKIVWSLLIALSLFTFSCSNDDTGSGANTPPVIEKVSPTLDEDGVPSQLESVNVGYASNMYIIQGSGLKTVKKIYFNDFEAAFNPNLVTDTAIFVTIDINTPYADASNKLKVVTDFGTAEYDFVVAPPAPIFHSFHPINAADGGQITIYGNFFLDPIVKVGDVQAEVVSNSLTEIVVTLPTGSQGKYVTVETISGLREWKTAIGTAIFDDAFYSPWDIESWNNHEYVSDYSKAFQGTTFIKKAMGAWDNIQGNWTWVDQLSGYTGIKFAIRTEVPGTMKFCFNGVWDETHLINTTTEWQEVKLTWAQLGNPAALQNLCTFQNFSKNSAGDGIANTIYIDNYSYTVD